MIQHYTRFRRLRSNEAIRSLVRETSLSVQDFIYPLFVCEGTQIKTEIPSMPQVYRFSIDQVIEECKEVKQHGIPAVLLFGIPAYKDETGSASWQENGIVQRAIQAIKQAVPDLLTIADVCMCEYTNHGHCGQIINGTVDNDTTLELLVKQSLSYAKAGADIIAPSDMMDGRVAAIRTALDENGYTNIPIMSYSAKFASAFYGPFRDAADSTPKFGDRKSYQMDYCNTRMALREIEADIQEGADIIMVKPALAYLDIIAKARELYNTPIAAYNVSGEYSMVYAASQNGWIDGEKLMMEMLYSIKRAGADIIITYFAKKAAKFLYK
ncbi:MAG: porphobilinogen synthase [Bacteroidales bacterium]